MTGSRVAFALLVLFMVSFATARVSAHASGLSRGEYQRNANGLHVTLVFAASDAAGLVPELDRNHDGELDSAELTADPKAMAESCLADLQVAQTGKRCDVIARNVALAAEGGVRLVADFRCADAEKPIELELSFLDRLATGHRHAVHVEPASTAGDELYFGTQRRFSVPALLTAGGERGAPAIGNLDLVRLGFEHILAGADHIVFLFALALSVTRLKSLLGIVTAFSVAHSLTLALVVMKVVVPPVALVEAGIALSVAYVGVENLLGVEPAKRWRVAFAFGLVHGFGFAGALGELAIPRAELGRSLLSFNLGVELGQLALLAGLLPALLALRRLPRFGARLAPALSLAVVVAGLGWFATRAY